MAEFRTPFFNSYLANDPDLVRLLLKERPKDFPKSERIGEGLRPLLGRSVFLTNGALWESQRRIIDPAFEGGRLRESFPAILAAADAAVVRLNARSGETVEIEAETSHAAADVIFRTLFSIPIEDEIAGQAFEQFRKYQRSQPLLNMAAFLPLPRWLPRGFRRETRQSAQDIRALIGQLVHARAEQIKTDAAPIDLATKIMTTPDPHTGKCFDAEQMVDQVAIFFMAGHETSASALAWALYLMALFPEWQEQVAAEATALAAPEFADMSKLKVTRDVFRETLRLYPPVPMMVRESTQDETFRKRSIRSGAQIVLSPWHLHRHNRIWSEPDAFDPGRWDTEEGRACARDAYIPFSAGPRVCPGAGFAMLEGTLMLARIIAHFRVEPGSTTPPVPVAHLTVRARDGIPLRIVRR